MVRRYEDEPSPIRPAPLHIWRFFEKIVILDCAQMIIFDVLFSPVSHNAAHFYLSFHSVTTLIPLEIRSVVKHASLKSLHKGDACSPSESFNDYAFTLLSDNGLLAPGVILETFIPCDYVAEIQKALKFTNMVDTSDVSFSDLVVVPEDMISTLQGIFGNETVINGQFLLDTFRNLSVIRLMRFINSFVAPKQAGENEASSRRMLTEGVYHDQALLGGRSQTVKRGSIINTVQDKTMAEASKSFKLGSMQPFDLLNRHLASADPTTEPVVKLVINEYLTFDFDFNFGNGVEELLFGVHFLFDSGDTGETAIKEMLNSFLKDTVGDNAKDDLGGSATGFSFVNATQDLAESLIESIVIGVRADISVAFGLNLHPIFEKPAGYPNPFVKINTFELNGSFGVNEWVSSTLFILYVCTKKSLFSRTLLLPKSYNAVLPDPLDMFKFGTSEAKALVTIDATIPSAPVVIESPADFLSFIHPNNGTIEITASLDVSLPVFVTMHGLGYGALIEYNDTNVLDNQPSNVSVT